jgi:DNA-directed RNA polymerase subunit K/omega
MATNGHTALKLVEPPSAPEPQAPSERELEEIGSAVANAATILAVAMLEFEGDGRMRGATRTEGAERIARVARLELDMRGENHNFVEIARREGVRRLRKLLVADPNFQHHHGAAAGDVALREIVDGVLQISGQVAALEIALATN